MRKWTLRAVALIVVALVAGVTSPLAAYAQDLEAPVDDGSGYVESWALSPVGDQPGEASSRPNLTYSVAPGSTVEDAVTLWNYSSVPVLFRLVSTDAFNNDTGEFAVLSASKPSADLGSWIELGTDTVTVPARTSVTIPVTLRVPADATPGDHAAAVLAASDTVGVDAQGNEVRLDRRTGPRVYLRVAGAVDPALVVEDVGSKYHGEFNPFSGSLDVSYTVRNPGNVRLGAKQQLVVTDIFGRTVATERLRPIKELLPGNAVTFHESVDGVPATLRVKARIELEPIAPTGVSDELPEPVSASTSAWAIPWTLLLLLALAYLLWRLYRRWRDQREELPPTEPTMPEPVPEPVGR